MLMRMMEMNRASRARQFVASISALEFAPPSVAVVTVLPSKGADPNLPLDPKTKVLQKLADEAEAALAPQQSTTATTEKEHAALKSNNKKSKKPFKKKKTEEQIQAEERVKMLKRNASQAIKNTIRLYALVVQGRPVRHRPCYCMEDFNIDDASPAEDGLLDDGGIFSRPLGNPVMVRKIMLVPEPDIWMKCRQVWCIWVDTCRSLKKAPTNCWSKRWAAKALEFEEKAIKALEIAEARAVFLKQAVERSIAMGKGMVSGTLSWKN